MEYVSVAEARKMSGMRLALSAGTPGPWSISARALFTIRNIPFVPVMQVMMEPNAELVEWTGRRNAPVAVWNDEPAQDGWLEIAVMAERLGSGPSIFPDDPLDRALATGLSAELAGQGGFGWARRLSMTASAPPTPEIDSTARDAMMRQYGARPGAAEGQLERAVGIVKAFSAQIRKQHEAGRDWLVGDRLSLCDVHWACFAMLVDPLPHEQCPMPEGIRAVYSQVDPEISEAVDPLLLDLRDRVFRDHIGLPLEV